MYMADIKLVAKTEKELETLIQAVIIYSQDIGAEFGKEKCVTLIMRSRKRHIMEGIELPNQQKIRMLGEKEIYKYLEIFGNIGKGHNRTSRDERKIKNESLWRTRKLLESKLHSRNLIKGINAWAVSLVWYSEQFLKWTSEELQKMNQRTRKLLMMHKALHPSDDVDRLYVNPWDLRVLAVTQRLQWKTSATAGEKSSQRSEIIT